MRPMPQTPHRTTSIRQRPTPTHPTLKELVTMSDTYGPDDLDQFECDHVWIIRPESDTRVCEMCDLEG